MRKRALYIIENCSVFSSSRSESRKVNLRSKFTFYKIHWESRKETMINGG